MVATILGTFDYFVYTSENGKNYEMRQRAADALALGNVGTPRGVLPSLPRYLRPRHVWVQSPLGARRRINIGRANNALYLQGGTVNIDSTSFTVSGRVGEKDVGAVKD